MKHRKSPGSRQKAELARLEAGPFAHRTPLQVARSTAVMEADTSSAAGRPSSLSYKLPARSTPAPTSADSPKLLALDRLLDDKPNPTATSLP